jgi:MinD superfamily P-loop ATPase
MKKIAIISGKGGVGKSMLASSLAILFSQDKHKIVAVDCDVDAPNLAVWLNEIGNWDEKRKISVSEKPLIDNNKINSAQAQKCAPKCKFKALIVEKDQGNLALILSAVYASPGIVFCHLNLN